MAQVTFRGVPDFTQVHLEVAKIKQEIAGISTTPMQGVTAAARSAKTAVADMGQQVGVFVGPANAGASAAKEYIRNINGLGNASVKATGMVRNAAGEFQTFTASVKNSDGTLSNFQIAIDKSTGSVYKLSKGTSEATNVQKGLLTNFKEMVKYQAIWMSAIAVLNAFGDAFEQMKKVDDELVVVRKVTGATTEELESLKDRAYETASAYGEMADEYLNSVAAFTRAGYKEQAADLAELATKTKIVGDTTAETAQQYLLSVDAAYQYNGNIQKLSAVLDGANEIDNKYATSIEKIAEGLGTVAPVAAQAHVGIDELTAAIGTITAVTQRSGTEAARAFRALVLNILGDPKTEIDEGVTWTTGEIAGLKDVIKLYAKDAYDAAQATGNVINPMKAIGGLAQSMKEGVLTEQKLMEMVSDIGGKLRTSQLLALIQNWDMYESMLADYGNAVGSADKEVENALDSWTRKTNILNNKWSEFISHLVDTETIKSGLDVVIGLVEVLDTDAGQLILTVAAIELGVIGVTAAVKGLGKAWKALSLKSLNPWLITLAASSAAVLALLKVTEDQRKSIEELDAALEESNGKLEENRKRLQEISEIPWGERTSEIRAEQDALEKENEALQDQIDKYAELKQKKAEEILSGSSVGTTVGTVSYQVEGEFSSGRTRRRKRGSEVDAERMANVYSTLTKKLKQYQRILNTAHELSDEQQEDYDKTVAQAERYATAMEAVSGGVSACTQEQQNMYAAFQKTQTAYYAAQNYIQIYVDGLLEQVKKTAEATDNLYDLAQAEIVANDKNLTFTRQIAALQKSLLSELDSAVQKKLDDAKTDRDAELDAIQAQIDALKEKNEAEDAALEMEEKRAAITEKQNDLLEKQKALLEARNERTVRTYNAKTNQWEWIADAKNVKSAEDALKSAQDALEKAQNDLADYNKKLQRDAEVAALEAKKDQINAHYDALENAWSRIMDALGDPVREINDILKDIAENATPELREQILKNRDLFAALGIDLSAFTDVVKAQVEKIYAISSGGQQYGIGSDRGLDFVNNAPAGSTMTGSDGSQWTKNPDGTTTITKNGQTYTTTGQPNHIVRVQPDGKAPPGCGVGDWVVTAAGTYQITAVNPDGSYQSVLIDRSKTTSTYPGPYYDKGGWLNGMGGIKATSRPETVLPPELTEKLLSPAADATFRKRMGELGFLYGATDKTPVTAGGTVTNSNVTNNNGAHYHYRDIVLTEEQARGMSLYQLTKLSGNLGNFNNL